MILWTSGWRKSTKSTARAQSNHEESVKQYIQLGIKYRYDRFNTNTKTQVKQAQGLYIDQATNQRARIQVRQDPPIGELGIGTRQSSGNSRRLRSRQGLTEVGKESGKLRIYRLPQYCIIYLIHSVVPIYYFLPCIFPLLHYLAFWLFCSLVLFSSLKNCNTLKFLNVFNLSLVLQKQ